MTYYGRSRPGTVTAASVLLYVMGGLTVIGALLSYAVAGEVLPSDRNQVVVLATLLLVCGVVYLVVATKILGGSSTARIAAIVFMAIGVVLELVDWERSSPVTVAIAVLVVALLTMGERTREYFA